MANPDMAFLLRTISPSLSSVTPSAAGGTGGGTRRKPRQSAVKSCKNSVFVAGSGGTGKKRTPPIYILFLINNVNSQ